MYYLTTTWGSEVDNCTNSEIPNGETPTEVPAKKGGSMASSDGSGLGDGWLGRMCARRLAQFRWGAEIWPLASSSMMAIMEYRVSWIREEKNGGKREGWPTGKFVIIKVNVFKFRTSTYLVDRISCSYQLPLLLIQFRPDLLALDDEHRKLKKSSSNYHHHLVLGSRV